ncbi:MAG TPA: hypothetical protein VNI01_12535, partial [Elusimicrobiota bacterium]|nr:hypothetical protein [Elusimicrobiota bacterium]
MASMSVSRACLGLLLLAAGGVRAASAPTGASARCDAGLLPDPVPSRSRGRTLHVSVSGRGLGTEADPMSLREALKRASPGDKVVLGSGIYHLGASSAPVRLGPPGSGPEDLTVFEAAPCARVILTSDDELPPAIVVSDYVRLERLWIGGKRLPCHRPKGLGDPGDCSRNAIVLGAVPRGVGRELVNNTIFGYFGGIVQGSSEKSLYQGNRFVRVGGGSWGHPIYIS